MVFIIGMGPGGLDYILPAAWKAAEKCRVLFGSPRYLDLFTRFTGEKHSFTNNLAGIIEYIKREQDGKNIGILVSGDPGFYSLLKRIKNELVPGSYEVVPGISTLSLASARCGIPWQETAVISVHGREIDSLVLSVSEALEQKRPVFFLTDNKNSPQAVASRLLAGGILNLKATVLENLSYENERITKTNLEILSEGKGADICVVIIYPPGFTELE